MPLSIGKIALTQFATDFDNVSLTDIGDALKDECFLTPSGTHWQMACGWIPWGEAHAEPDFSRTDRWSFAPYIGLQLRVDTKKVNSSLLRLRTGEAAAAWCQENGRARCPASVRKGFKESIEDDLLSHAQPAPAAYDVIINTASGRVYLGTQKKSTVELFVKQWKVTFPAIPLRPMGFQVEDPGTAAATVDASEFLLWLWWRMSMDSTFRGPNGPFNVWITDMIKMENLQTASQTLVSGDESATQPESLAALNAGKVPTQLSLGLEYDSQEFSFTLKGSPIELSQAALPATAKEGWAGRLYDRVFLLELLQALVQALHDDFRQAYADGWSLTVAKIRLWLEADPTV